MADYFGTDTVVSELRDDGLLIIRINRPEVANALNGVTSAAMENIMNHAETDKAVRAPSTASAASLRACAPSRSSAPATARRPAAAWRSRFPATWW